MPDIQIQGFPANLVLRKVTIANGVSKSEMIATDGMALVGIFMPAAWTAADIGYEIGWDGNQLDTFAVYSGSGIASTTVATASTFITFPATDSFYGPFLKLTSVAAGGGSVTPVNQGAARDLLLLFRKLFS